MSILTQIRVKERKVHRTTGKRATRLYISLEQHSRLQNELKPDIPETFEVKLSDTLPSMRIYIVSNDAEHLEVV